MRTASVLLISLLAVVVYFLPFLVANHRRHRNQAGIGALNLFLGWTFVGWVVALVWALAVDRTAEAADGVRASGSLSIADRDRR